MVRRKVNWSLRSIKDKVQIYEYLIHRNKSINYALKLDDLFNKSLAMTSSFPFAGTQTNIENVRFREVRGYKLVYKIEEDSIDVLTVFSSKQDPEKLIF